ncbi:MAG TPA: acetylornithine/succinylornithine family transaminase [Candidatus Kapabacteria bacterium]|nr:acetylornithine/succinylornithine family transaminase [Candidatus Kapabacteria bacterium]
MVELTREQIIEQEQNDFIQVYNRLPIVIDRADGIKVWDKNGRVYLDFLAGIAVDVLGHSHPKIIEAIEKQAKRYLHTSNYLYQDIQIEFVKKLKKMSGFNKVFLSNSGTESIEGAIKLVRKWGNQHNKDEIISFTGGFHGRTYGALSMMDKPLYKNNFGPFLDGFKILPYNSISDLKSNINEKTSGVFLEFIQGEGGVVPANQDFIDILFELKNKYNFLIVADEIQAGMGRTGKFFAFEHYNVEPDIATSSKGLGGGLPLGAILVRDYLKDVFQKSEHGSTFGGNPLACATGLASLIEIENNLMDNTKIQGGYFINKLKGIASNFPKFISNVQGKGLMIGLKLTFPAKDLVNKLLDYGIISNATNQNVLRIVPPLIINKQDIDEFCLALNKSLETFE